MKGHALDIATMPTAVERATRELEKARGQVGNVHPETARRLAELGVALAAEGRFDDAEDVLRESLSILGVVAGSSDPRKAQVCCRLASVLQASGRFDEAERLYRGAIESLYRTLGPDEEVTLAAEDLHTDLLKRMQLPN